MAGKLRLSVLHVLKLRHGGDNGWRNNYFIFAENRPLLALHQVPHDKMVTACLTGDKDPPGIFQGAWKYPGS